MVDGRVQSPTAPARPCASEANSIAPSSGAISVEQRRRLVCRDLLVPRQQGQTFDPRMDNEHAIEWIAMQRREFVDGDFVRARDLQFLAAGPQ